MAYRWPTDPPGKPPAHTKSWQEHQSALALTQAGSAAAGVGTAAGGTAAPSKGVVRPLTPGAPAAAPTSAGTPAAGGTAAATITPDAQYLAEAAQRAFQRTTQLNRLTEEGQNDKTNTATAITRLLENSIGDRVKINEGANRAGLLYSGQRQKQIGEYDTQLNRAKGDAETLLSQREAARLAERTAIEEGGPLDEATAMADAGSRQTARDQSAASLQALVPNVAPLDTGGQGAAMAALLGKGFQEIASNKRDSKGRKGKIHVYPDGRTVWVPTA